MPYSYIVKYKITKGSFLYYFLGTNMSGGLDVLGLKEDDVTKMLAATTHLGAENVNFQMEQYVYKRNSRGKLIY